MAKYMNLPKIGVNMKDALIGEWTVKEGDKIEFGEVIMNAETDKDMQDIIASESGTLLKILIPNGGLALVQKPIAIVGEPGEDISALVAGFDAVMKGEEAPAAAPAKPAAPAPKAAAPKKFVPKAKASVPGMKVVPSYDVIVIGGGPGGYVAAIRCAQLGMKTAVVERDNLGGTCLNWGCIPTKALVRNAEVISYLKEGKKFGFSLDESSIKPDYAAAQKRSREVSAKLVKGINFLMGKNNIDVINGEATFVTAKQINVGGKPYEAQNYIIATGARPNLIPGVEPGDPNIMTSRQALELTELPEKIVVIGAGAIGMEFACLWSAFGAQVTVVEMADRVLPLEDADVSKEVEKAIKARGLTVKTSTKVMKLVSDKNGVKLTLSAGDKEEILECGKVMLSAGVRPNTENIGLEKIGVNKTERGHIVIDDQMRTSVEGIYAIGDITGKLALAHTASKQGEIAAEVIAGKDTKAINYSNLPRCTYTTPEVASVGLSEKQALDQGLKIKVGTFPFSANGKALAMGEPNGFVKVIADEKYGEILGVHMVGAHVTEMIAGPTAYIDAELTNEDVAAVVHPHPTMSEAIMEAMLGVDGKAVHI